MVIALQKKNQHSDSVVIFYFCNVFVIGKSYDFEFNLQLSYLQECEFQTV